LKTAKKKLLIITVDVFNIEPNIIGLRLLLKFLWYLEYYEKNQPERKSFPEQIEQREMLGEELTEIDEVVEGMVR